MAGVGKLKPTAVAMAWSSSIEELMGPTAFPVRLTGRPLTVALMH